MAAFVASGASRVASTPDALDASLRPTAPTLPPATPAATSETDPAALPVEATPKAAQTDLERAEEQIYHWRRQAIIWRERALEARALGEAYKENVDDLRKIVEILKRQSTSAHSRHPLGPGCRARR